MLLDIITVLFLIYMFIKGYRKGTVVAAFSLLSILIGLFLALKLSNAFANFLYGHGVLDASWAPIFSFVVLFILLVLAVRIGASYFDDMVDLSNLGTINNLIGGVLYFFLGCLVWSCFLWFMDASRLIAFNRYSHSQSYAVLKEFAPNTFERIGRVIPFARGAFDDLRMFFDRVRSKIR